MAIRIGVFGVENIPKKRKISIINPLLGLPSISKKIQELKKSGEGQLSETLLKKFVQSFPQLGSLFNQNPQLIGIFDQTKSKKEKVDLLNSVLFKINVPSQTEEILQSVAEDFDTDFTMQRKINIKQGDRNTLQIVNSLFGNFNLEDKIAELKGLGYNEREMLESSEIVNARRIMRQSGMSNALIERVFNTIITPTPESQLAITTAVSGDTRPALPIAPVIEGEIPIFEGQMPQPLPSGELEPTEPTEPPFARYPPSPKAETTRPPTSPLVRPYDIPLPDEPFPHTVSGVESILEASRQSQELYPALRDLPFTIRRQPESTGFLRDPFPVEPVSMVALESAETQRRAGAPTEPMLPERAEEEEEEPPRPIIRDFSGRLFPEYMSIDQIRKEMEELAEKREKIKEKGDPRTSAFPSELVEPYRDIQERIILLEQNAVSRERDLVMVESTIESYEERIQNPTISVEERSRLLSEISNLSKTVEELKEGLEPERGVQEELQLTEEQKKEFEKIQKELEEVSPEIKAKLHQKSQKVGEKFEREKKALELKRMKKEETEIRKEIEAEQEAEKLGELPTPAWFKKTFSEKNVRKLPEQEADEKKLKIEQEMKTRGITSPFIKVLARNIAELKGINNRHVFKESSFFKKGDFKEATPEEMKFIRELMEPLRVEFEEFQKQRDAEIIRVRKEQQRKDKERDKQLDQKFAEEQLKLAKEAIELEKAEKPKRVLTEEHKQKLREAWAKKAEEKAKKKAEEEEAIKKTLEEAKAKMEAEEEEKRLEKAKKKAEEEAKAKKKAEEEAKAKKKAEEEAIKKKAEEEAQAKMEARAKKAAIPAPPERLGRGKKK